MIFRFFYILFFIWGFSAPALAAAPLIFAKEPRNAREDSLITYLESTKKLFSDLPFSIAAIDLNGDGVDEWIVRQDRSSGCQANNSCDFIVAGLSKNKPVILGEFQARKVGIDDYKSYGVQRLQVYNLKNDDFSYTTYYWKPEKAAFLP